MSFLECHDLTSCDMAPFKDIHLFGFFDETIWIESDYLFFDKKFGAFRNHDIEVDFFIVCNVLK